MHELTQSRVQVITGKGGVGKSAVAAALALALAQNGKKRVLLATLNGVDDLSRLLGCLPLDTQEREVLPGVWGVAMTGEAARLEYAIKVLKFERMARLVFANRLMRSLLDFVPGLNAVNQLGKLRWHLLESRTSRFDHVVLEAPASGHALTTLRSPALIHQMSPPGPMRRETANILSFLRNPKTTRVHVVTLPASMSCRESVQLAAALRQRAEMHLGLLICNRTLPVAPKGEPEAAQGAWAEFLSAEANAARREHDRLTRTAEESNLPRFDLPELPGNGRAVVAAMAERFLEVGA
jgi:anion-transporting  ArsA/GET3 family ATPase